MKLSGTWNVDTSTMPANLYELCFHPFHGVAVKRIQSPHVPFHFHVLTRADIGRLQMRFRFPAANFK
ncbi:hypothetical protein VTO42DRAFT_8269 [Malbranchea cinnamomea]